MSEFQANSYWIVLCNSLNGSKYLLTRTTWLTFEISTTEVRETLSPWPVTRRGFSQMATCHFKCQILSIFYVLSLSHQTPFPDASMSGLFNRRCIQETWEFINLPCHLCNLLWDKTVGSLCSTSLTVFLAAAKKMELQPQPKETGPKAASL